MVALCLVSQAEAATQPPVIVNQTIYTQPNTTYNQGTVIGSGFSTLRIGDNFGGALTLDQVTLVDTSSSNKTYQADIALFRGPTGPAIIGPNNQAYTSISGNIENIQAQSWGASCIGILSIGPSNWSIHPNAMVAGASTSPNLSLLYESLSGDPQTGNIYFVLINKGTQSPVFSTNADLNIRFQFGHDENDAQ